MTKQSITDLVGEMEAEHAKLRLQGAVQFDGGVAWAHFTQCMGESALEMAKHFRNNGEAGPPLLPNHFGTADE